jgi:AcrR family transcriptional regulator
MMDEELTIMDRIIVATLNCIEKQGIDKLTIRSIAREANVNSASINYYFRSKNLLLDEAVKMSLDNAFGDWERILDVRGSDPRSRIEAFLLEFLSGAIRYPGITKAYLFHPLMKDQRENLFMRRFNNFLDGLLKNARELLPDESEEQLKFGIMHILYSLTCAGLLPDLFSGFSGNSLTDEPVRKIFVQNLMKHYLR